MRNSTYKISVLCLLLIFVFSQYVSLSAYESKGSGDTLCMKGKLTDEGTECQAFRSDKGNKLYTLVGDLAGYSNGDAVWVCGEPVEGDNFCMQGEKTILIQWIGKKKPKL